MKLKNYATSFLITGLILIGILFPLMNNGDFALGTNIVKNIVIYGCGAGVILVDISIILFMINMDYKG